MNPLQSRKKLLIAESELNRAQLVQDWQTMADDVHVFTKQARTISSFASAAVSLVAALISFRRKKAKAAAEKHSWLQTILKGAQIACSLWTRFSQQSREQENK